MATPTQSAEYSFRQARSKLENLAGEAFGRGSDRPRNARKALIAMCDGLGHLSVGLRATYALLSEVKTELAQPAGFPVTIVISLAPILPQANAAKQKAPCEERLWRSVLCVGC